MYHRIAPCHLQLINTILIESKRKYGDPGNALFDCWMQMAVALLAYRMENYILWQSKSSINVAYVKQGGLRSVLHSVNLYI